MSSFTTDFIVYAQIFLWSCVSLPSLVLNSGLNATFMCFLCIFLEIIVWGCSVFWPPGCMFLCSIKSCLILNFIAIWVKLSWAFPTVCYWTILVPVTAYQFWSRLRLLIRVWCSVCSGVAQVYCAPWWNCCFVTEKRRALGDWLVGVGQCMTDQSLGHHKLRRFCRP